MRKQQSIMAQKSKKKFSLYQIFNYHQTLFNVGILTGKAALSASSFYFVFLMRHWHAKAFQTILMTLSKTLVKKT